MHPTTHALLAPTPLIPTLLIPTTLTGTVPDPPLAAGQQSSW